MIFEKRIFLIEDNLFRNNLEKLDSIINTIKDKLVNTFKIALVNPGPGDILEKGRILANADHVYPPLGICYISSVLKNENYQVDLIDQAAMG